MVAHDTPNSLPDQHDPRSALDESDPLSVVFHLAGQAGLDRFLTTCGGRTLYVPKRIVKAHPLVALFGPETALELASRFGGERFHIPTDLMTPCRSRLAERLAALRAAKPEMTVAMVASAAGCSERQAYRCLARVRRGAGGEGRAFHPRRAPQRRSKGHPRPRGAAGGGA